MRPLETWLLNYVVNALWQVPIVFAAAWIAARTSRRAGPSFQHALWTSALAAEVLLPACSARPDQAFLSLLHWLASFRQSSAALDPHVTVTIGPVQAATTAGFHVPPALLAAAALLYFVGFVYFVTRLGIGLHRTASLRRRAEPLALTGHAGQSYHRFAHLFGVQDSIVAASAEIASPITLGIRRPVLLLPSELDTTLLGEDLDAALAHEFAHMRRRDFAKNLAYEVLSLPIAFHPLLWLTRGQMSESRELVCDAMAADAVAGRQRYARSLLRLATKFSQQTSTPTPHAIGIFDANPFKNFERRIMSLTNNPMELRGAARLAVAALSLFLIAGACTSALAFRMQVAAPPTQTTPAPTPTPSTITTVRYIRMVAPVTQTTTPQTETPTTNPSPNPAPAPTVKLYVPSPGNPPSTVILAMPRPTTGQPAPSFKADIDDASGPNPVVKILTPVTVETPQTAAPPTIALTIPRAGEPARSYKLEIADGTTSALPAGSYTLKVLPPTSSDHVPQVSPGLHVAGGVIAGNRLIFAEPVYPEDAKKAKLSGTVVLHAIIGKDGKIDSLTVAASTNPMFNNSAMEAVRQWTYKPYLLNGNPTAVDTTITVNYALSK